MKKFIARLIVVVTLFLSFSPTLVLAQEVEPGKADYHIATGQNYMPFSFELSDGTTTGIDIEILNAIARDQNFTFSTEPLQLAAILQSLESGQADAGMAALSITEERKKSLDFTDPYYSSGSSFTVAADSDIEGFEDLEGHSVATKVGSMGNQIAESLKDEYGYTVSAFEESSAMYEDVTAGNSDALIEDHAVISYAILTGVHDLKTIGEELVLSDLAIAVKKGENQDFLEKYNAGLANIRASGEYDEIINSFVGAESIEESEVANQGGFFDQVKVNSSSLLKGLWTTIRLALMSIVFAIILGLILGLMRISNQAVIKALATAYIYMMRGLPMIVLAFFIYFGIPQIFNINLSATVAGILTLSLNAAAYFAEIFRGGIEAVPKGQSEASYSLGMSRFNTMRYIVLPQAIRMMVPSIINQFIITLKDTSILSVIGIVELTQTGRVIIARTYQSGNIWLIIGTMYIVLITALTLVSQQIEKRIK